MHISYFSERPYRWLDEELVLKSRSFFGISNAHYDRLRASDDYNYYLDEFCAADEWGFDGLVLNEHHGTPFCMGNVMNVEAAILARITKNAQIVLLGNPLPVTKHPVRMAEELAEIDLISHGRLVSGWVRGAGSEQFFNNANPAYNRELFEEAHDLVVKTWTTPGPWRYEGKHFHFRHINPWALPYQQPHPPIVIPGVLSAETAIWCAEHRYPYVGLGAAIGPTTQLWDLYADRAAELGYQAGPENFGYLVGTYVADTEEEAQEGGKSFVWGGGQAAFASPEYALPPGYNSPDALKRLSQSREGSWLGLSGEKLREARGPGASESAIDFDEVRKKLSAGYAKAQERHTLIIGTPEQVIEKACRVIDILRTGMFVFMNVQGPLPSEQRMRSVKLLADEVLPAVRAYADSLGLLSPFERTPGSVPLASGATRGSVVNRELLNSLGLG